MEERTVDLGVRRGNLRLNVAFAGPERGRPVVLLHGFPESWWSWRYQIEALTADGFRVIAPDLRGAGKSEIRGPYELSELADDIDALVEIEVGDASIPIVGHDWGGATAWTLARRHPKRPSRLAIVNSCLPERQIEALSTEFDAKQFSRSWYVLLFQIPWLADSLLARNNGALVKEIIRAGMKERDSVTDAELEPFRLAAVRPGGARGMLSPYRSAFRRALADLVRTGDPFPERGPIDCPTLLAWGDSDPAQGFSLVTGMQSVVRDLRIVRFPRCGHFPHSETPQAVNDVLLPFLAEA